MSYLKSFYFISDSLISVILASFQSVVIIECKCNVNEREREREVMMYDALVLLRVV